jgi:tetratricopeptide (TPR) repeat protein
MKMDLRRLAMNHTHLRSLCAGALVLAIVGLVRADDRLDFRKDDKIASIVGQVADENVSGLKFKPNTGKEFQVPVRDIVKVAYEMPGKVRLDYGNVAGLEEKRDYAKALEGYKAMLPQMGTGTDRAKRHVEYRIAMLKATLGEPDAMESLAAFLKAHPNAWQYSSAARQLTSLQIDKGEYDAAAKTVEAWSRLEGLSKELKQEADLMLIDVLFQAGKTGDVQGKVQAALAALPANDPQRAKLEVYVLGCQGREADIKVTVSKLEQIILKTDDPALKALAYNTMGDCYSLKGMKHEAKFSYLWVDAVYNQDRQEHVKALDRLTKLFETEPLKDPDRAQLFRDKAQRAR